MPKILKTIAGKSENPLLIGNIEIECYVLENKDRVITQRGLFRSLGFSYAGSIVGTEIPRFATSTWLKPFINNDLSLGLKSPIEFILPTGGAAYGYKATILVELCEALIEARNAGKISSRSRKYVERAESILRGLGRIGIVAWVDNVTGFNPFKGKEIIDEFIDRYINPVLRPWIPTFPLEFYMQIGKLKGWVNFDGKRRPSILGKITNSIIYRLLAPGVLEELQRLNPLLDGGFRKDKHHQWLSAELGYIGLKEHLRTVITIMEVSDNWVEFEKLLQRKFPRDGDRLFLDVVDVD